MKNASPALQTGKICYVQIPAADIIISSSFYKEVFHWEIRERPNGKVTFNDSTGQVSGAWVTGKKPASDSDLIIYIMVTNMEETLQMIIKCGGKITQPVGPDLPEITAKFSDPAGNILGLYQQPA